MESVDVILPGYRLKHQTSTEKTENANRLSGSSEASPVGTPLQSDGHANGHANGHDANGINNSLNSGLARGLVNGLSSAKTNGKTKGQKKSYFVLPFSAHDEKSLRANVEVFAMKASNWNLPDVAYTLSARRSLQTYRSYIITNTEQVQDGLQVKDLNIVKKQRAVAPVLGFVFTGKSIITLNASTQSTFEFHSNPFCISNVQLLNHALR